MDYKIILYFIIIVIPLNISSIIIPLWKNTCSENKIIRDWITLKLGQYVLAYGIANLIFSFNLFISMIILLNRSCVGCNRIYIIIIISLEISYHIIWSLLVNIIFFDYYLECFLKGEPLTILALIDWIVALLTVSIFSY
jgi:hypothetical protein